MSAALVTSHLPGQGFPLSAVPRTSVIQFSNSLCGQQPLCASSRENAGQYALTAIAAQRPSSTRFESLCTTHLVQVRVTDALRRASDGLLELCDSILNVGRPEQSALLPESRVTATLIPGPRAGLSFLGVSDRASVLQSTDSLENSPNPAAEPAPLGPTLTSQHPAR